MRAFPLILSAPSGGGKTTIAHELLATRQDVGYSISCTTRSPRAGETDGVDYHFLARAAFTAKIEAGEFAESAEVHGELYGTLRREVERVLAEDKHVIMDIDVQGARQLVRAFPQSVLVFVLPPSAEVLLERLRRRRTEDSTTLARRLATAIEELRAVSLYHYIVVNDDLPSAVSRIGAIIDAETVRRDRTPELDDWVERLIAELQVSLKSTNSS